MLSSYFFSGNAMDLTTPSDKLAFLLDEIEEASWRLKFREENGTSQHRPVFIFDDLDAVDLTDLPTQKAVRMLFNAAHKWAREDTAQVVFTFSEPALKSLKKIVRKEVLQDARVFHIGGLSSQEADDFLLANTIIPSSPECRRFAKEAVGTCIGDLVQLTQDANRLGRSLREVAHAQLLAAVEHVSTIMVDTAHSTTSTPVDHRAVKAFLKTLDEQSALPVDHKDGHTKSMAEILKATKSGNSGSLNTAFLEVWVEKGVLSENGHFLNEKLRRAFRICRNLEDKKFAG
ncbi:hypothetical protein HDV00_012640 [Rhizophlyctis rosea]|nr:hypothetical protein HDV00_012640 [Rhizophlyctis rosea]